MGDYEIYKNKLEEQFEEDLRTIIREQYITRGLGPSISAKQLEIPRKAFVYFIEHYNLKEEKYPELKKSSDIV